MIFAWLKNTIYYVAMFWLRTNKRVSVLHVASSIILIIELACIFAPDTKKMPTSRSCHVHVSQWINLSSVHETSIITVLFVNEIISPQTCQQWEASGGDPGRSSRHLCFRWDTSVIRFIEDLSALKRSLHQNLMLTGQDLCSASVWGTFISSIVRKLQQQQAAWITFEV